MRILARLLEGLLALQCALLGIGDYRWIDQSKPAPLIATKSWSAHQRREHQWRNNHLYQPDEKRARKLDRFEKRSIGSDATLTGAGLPTVIRRIIAKDDVKGMTIIPVCWLIHVCENSLLHGDRYVATLLTVCGELQKQVVQTLAMVISFFRADRLLDQSSNVFFGPFAGF